MTMHFFGRCRYHERIPPPSPKHSKPSFANEFVVFQQFPLITEVENVSGVPGSLSLVPYQEACGCLRVWICYAGQCRPRSDALTLIASERWKTLQESALYTLPTTPVYTGIRRLPQPQWYASKISKAKQWWSPFQQVYQLRVCYIGAIRNDNTRHYQRASYSPTAEVNNLI